MDLNADQQRDLDLLRRAEKQLSRDDGDGGYRGNEDSRRSIVRILKQWADEIERGTLRPAERDSARALAENVLNGSWP